MKAGEGDNNIKVQFGVQLHAIVDVCFQSCAECVDTQDATHRVNVVRNG